MKALIILLVVVVSSTAIAQAEIYVPESIHYFDTLQQGDRCEHFFYVKNTGNEPLIINTAKTSCGCDVATWPMEPIPPQGTAFIQYKYDSKRIGPINKSMTIESNDPDSPYLVVRVKGFVKPN